MLLVGVFKLEKLLKNNPNVAEMKNLQNGEKNNDFNENE